MTLAHRNRLRRTSGHVDLSEFEHGDRPTVSLRADGEIRRRPYGLHPAGSVAPGDAIAVCRLEHSHVGLRSGS
jgi:hypothetical protein